MATLSTLQCVTNSQNTGLTQCLLDILNVKGAFLCPPGYTIPAAAMATGLLAQLQGDARSDSKATRIFPIGNFADFKDGSEAPVEEKLGYGDVSTVRDGIYDWQFRFRVGGLDLSNRLRSFNRNGNYFLFVDSRNQLFGTKGFDATAAPAIAAINPIEFYQDVFKVNDGKKTSEYWSKFRFQPAAINENVAYCQDAGFDILGSVLGLQDITLSAVADATPGVYHVTVLAGAAKINLASLFPTQLASAALWNALNTSTSAAITVSTVALGTGANAGTFTVTLATTAPPYPVTVGLKIAINISGPTELATALIPGYESTGPALIAHN